MRDIFGDLDIVAGASFHNRSSLKRSFMTSTPKKNKTKPLDHDDEIVVLEVTARKIAPRQLFSTPPVKNIKKEAGCLEVNTSSGKIEEYLKLRKEIKHSYRRMTFRVDKMLRDGIKEDPNALENKIRQRSTSRSRRSRGADSSDSNTPVRRSSRLQAKENEKSIVDENNNESKSAESHSQHSSSATSTSHMSLDVSERMKQWIHDHPYVDRTAPILIFLIFAVLMCFFVNYLYVQQLPQQFASSVNHYGHQAYYKMQSFLK